MPMEAVDILDHLKQLRANRYTSAVHLATICGALGELEQAFAWLEQAYEERAGLLVFVKVSLHFDPLRGDPRFQALLRRMNFPSAGEPGAVQIDASRSDRVHRQPTTSVGLRHS